MGTPSAIDEVRIAKAIEEVRNKTAPSAIAAAQKWCVNYDVMRARMQGRQPNSSRGGQNKRLNEAQEATLMRHIERLIQLGENPGRNEIMKAANSILRTAGEEPVSKP
ncbi:hypothetical protein ACEPPN_017705 [Leptodophora sp. 'Broadleaf-Isolate-01']